MYCKNADSVLRSTVHGTLDNSITIEQVMHTLQATKYIHRWRIAQENNSSPTDKFYAWTFRNSEIYFNAYRPYTHKPSRVNCLLFTVVKVRITSQYCLLHPNQHEFLTKLSPPFKPTSNNLTINFIAIHLTHTVISSGQWLLMYLTLYTLTDAGKT